MCSVGGVVAEIFRDPSILCVGGGVVLVAEIFRDPYSVGGGVVAENFPWKNSCFQTFIVFCPNSFDSLPELLSIDCPSRTPMRMING